MKKILRISMCLLLISGMSTQFLYSEPGIHPDYRGISSALSEDLSNGYDQMKQLIKNGWNNQHVQDTIETVGNTLSETGKSIKNQTISLKNWFQKSDPNSFSTLLKKILLQYKDPRLLALIAALGIVNIGGVYMLCSKKSEWDERLIGFSCMALGLVGTALSGHILHMADSYITTAHT